MATTPTVTATADLPNRMADASKSIIDDGANHRTNSAGKTRSVNIKLAQSAVPDHAE